MREQMSDRFENEQQVSERLNLSVQTLRNWRCLGVGLPYYKISRAVRYRVKDVENYLASKRVEIQDN